MFVKQYLGLWGARAPLQSAPWDPPLSRIQMHLHLLSSVFISFHLLYFIILIKPIVSVPGVVCDFINTRPILCRPIQVQQMATNLDDKQDFW